MDETIYRDDDIAIIGRFKRIQRTRERTPVFIFLCGGNGDHPARSMVKSFISENKNPSFHNVFCIYAENMAEMNEFKSDNLLIQEAMIADASDCVILFAESVGSFCELGIFSALPYVSNILTVCHDKKYASSNGFMQGGPIKMIESHPSSLAKAFPVDLECPLISQEFTEFLYSVKEKALSEEYWRRKKLNSDPTEITVGGYVHEILDIVNYFAPINRSDVEVLYKKIKNFPLSTEIKVISPTISKSINAQQGLGKGITTDQILAFMISSKMILEEKDSFGNEWLSPLINPEHSFLFRNESNVMFQRALSGILLRKRRRGIEGAKNVYHRFDKRRS